MKRWKVAAVLSALLFIFGSMGFQVSQAFAAKYNWRYALEEVKGSVQDAYAQKFKEILEKKSHGEINLDIYPYGQLGTSSQMTELLQNGAIQFAFQSPGHLGSYIPEVQIFSVPYLFPGNEALIEKVLKHSKAIYNILGKCYEQKQLKLLSIIPEGWQIWNTKKPIHKPSDFDGFRMRVMTSPLLVAAYKAYGANPVPMPYSEIYSGLQLKMIDGEVNPFFSIEEMKFYEVTNYMIKADQLMFICTVASNAKFYDGLPDNIKKIVDEAVAGATSYIFDYQHELNQKRKAMILKKKPSMKYYELTAQEKAAFEKKAMAVRKKYVEIGGPEAKNILDTLVKEIATAENKSGA